MNNQLAGFLFIGLMLASVSDARTAISLEFDLSQAAAEMARQPDTFGIVRNAKLAPSAGDWRLEKDHWEWRGTISAPGATSVSVGFDRFELPPGARLILRGKDGFERGPYDRSHALPSGRFWSPIVPGDTVEVILEVRSPADRGQVVADLTRVVIGIRAPEAKSHATCSVDVVCAPGDPWRDEIRSTVVYTVVDENSGRATACSGTLVNDVPGSGTPFLLTAWHCGVSAENAESVVVYYNYESPLCNLRAAGRLDDVTMGATWLAGREDVDFTLLRLEEAPPEPFGAYYAGWDRGGAVPSGGVGIHHPQAHVKSINIQGDKLAEGPSCIIEGAAAPTHWVVDGWDLGVNEPVSSGSGLWDPQSRLLVGLLSGGTNLCLAAGADCYGKFAMAWDGPTAEQRLRDWLDPQGEGPRQVQGRDPNPRLVVDSIDVMDYCPGAASDGVVEAGEVAEMLFTLRARGGSFRNVAGRLLAPAGRALEIPAMADFGDFDRGDTGVNGLPLSLAVSPFMPCGDEIRGVLELDSDSGMLRVPFEYAIGSQPSGGAAELIAGGGERSPAFSFLEVRSDVALTDLDVTVDIEHTWIGDLVVTLLGPDGTRVNLIERPTQELPGGGLRSCSNDNLAMRFDDESAIDDLKPFCSGDREDLFQATEGQPNDPLAVFDGKSARGVWTLIVEDFILDDTGRIVSWSLVTTPPVGEECDRCAPAAVGEWILDDGFE